jgi:hypothetical protein
MKLKFFVFVTALAMLSCNSPKKESESKTTAKADSLKDVPKDQRVTQKIDSSTQQVTAKTEKKTELAKVDQKSRNKKSQNLHGSAKREASATDKDFGPLSGTVPDLGTIPFEKSTPVSFKEFHSKTLKRLPLLRLPLDMEQTAAKAKVHAYPQDAFNMPNGFNAERMLVGMLPDTTTYYAIVWKGYLPDPRNYTSPGKHTLTYLTTFSKSGKMISNAQVQLEFYPEGPSDCGEYKSEHHSVIEADYSFTSTQETSFKCPGDADARTTSEKLFGNVERNGIIVVHKTNGDVAKGGGR